MFFNSIIKENKQLAKDINKLEKEYAEHNKNKTKLKNLKKIKSNYNNASESYYLLEEIDSFYSNLSLLSSENNLKIKKVDKKILNHKKLKIKKITLQIY